MSGNGIGASASLRIGVYPGTFDPVHNGHLDIILRGLRVVDRLVVGVAINAGKGPLFSLEERAALIRAEIADLASAEDAARISIVGFESLLIDFIRSQGAGLILRGLRAVADFEYEFQMASMNARLAPEIETVFLTASDRQQFISSRFVKEIARHGGDIRHFTSARVTAAVEAKLKGAA